MTQTILQVDSSILGDDSVSSKLVQKLVDQLTKNVENASVITRDLGKNTLPHLDSNILGRISNGSAEDANKVIEEAQQADVIVIGAPMYNFFIPSQLKTWLDYLARAKVTFEYTPNGPKGLLTNKKVYVVTTRGGQHKDTETDVLTPYLKVMLGFVGLNDVDFIFVEGLNTSGDTGKKELAAAEKTIESISNPFNGQKSVSKAATSDEEANT